jgi:hypothetical protein
MQPTWITVHATANQERRTDALAHARLLLRGLPSKDPRSRTGFVTWHLTVDDQLTVQHLPCAEQADHADFSGPGNQTSIGIEMACAQGLNTDLILHRSAMLIALLLHRYRLSDARVVPHQHWPRGTEAQRKDCPSVLLDAGEIGPRWKRFVALSLAYRKGLAGFPIKFESRLTWSFILELPIPSTPRRMNLKDIARQHLGLRNVSKLLCLTIGPNNAINTYRAAFATLGAKGRMHPTIR